MPTVQLPRSRLPTVERRAEIVAATLQLLAERSPETVTTADIAVIVGVTQGAVFKHFPTKDAIWLAAMQWVGEQLLEALQNAARAAESPSAALRAVYAAHVAFLARHPGAARLVLHELQRPGDSDVKQRVRRLLRDYRLLLTGLLEAGIAGGAIDRGLDVEAAASMFVGVVQGQVMQAMMTGDVRAMRREADRQFALLARGIGATTASPGGRR